MFAQIQRMNFPKGFLRKFRPKVEFVDALGPGIAATFSLMKKMKINIELTINAKIASKSGTL